VVCLSEKDYDKAETLFAEAMDKLGPKDSDADRNRFRARRVTSLYQAGKGMDAYHKVGPVTSTFPQLAWFYLYDKKLDGLKELIDAHDKKAPTDVHTIFWRGQWYFEKTEYAAAAEAYRRFRSLAKNDDGNLYSANERFLRSLLRTGKAAEARTLLKSLGDKPVNNWLRAAVAAAVGDLAEVERILGEQKGEWAIRMVYEDEDFARESAGPKFDEIRKKFPPPKKLPVKPDT
jgi:tetratricopeptide (TPR) repeat protein